jgi:hypothetical protein
MRKREGVPAEEQKKSCTKLYKIYVHAVDVRKSLLILGIKIIYCSLRKIGKDNR